MLCVDSFCCCGGGDGGCSGSVELIEPVTLKYLLKPIGGFREQKRRQGAKAQIRRVLWNRYKVLLCFHVDRSQVIVAL